MSAAPLALLVLAASAAAGPLIPTFSPADRGEGLPKAKGIAGALAAFRAGDYAKAARSLPALGGALPRNRDYTLYFLGESQFYAGDYGKARTAFTELGKARDSRFAAMAPWRAADCLWMEGKRQDAAAAYRKLIGGKSASDPAVARFRIAEVLAETARTKGNGASSEAAQAYMQVHVDFPAHPLGVEAGRCAALLAPTGPGATASTEPSPQERLQRAATLSKGRKWLEAVDELALLPPSLAPELAIQRDLATGMAKYHARRDYA